MSLQNSLKQASVKAFRFDVICNFYRGFQHILQASNNHISIATLPNQNIFTSPEHLRLL